MGGDGRPPIPLSSTTIKCLRLNRTLLSIPKRFSCTSRLMTDSQDLPRWIVPQGDVLTMPLDNLERLSIEDKMERISRPPSTSGNSLSACWPSCAWCRWVNRSVIVMAPITADAYSGIIPIVPSHVSTSSGHRVIGNFVGRSPKACLPSVYKCISTGTPAFCSAM